MSNFYVPLGLLAVIFYLATGYMLGRLKLAICLNKRYIRFKNGFLGEFLWPLSHGERSESHTRDIPNPSPYYFQNNEDVLLFQTFFGVLSFLMSSCIFILYKTETMLYIPFRGLKASQ